MSTFPNFLSPPSNSISLHFQHRFFFFFPRFTIVKEKAIRSSKFDFNSPEFDGGDDFKFKRRRNRGGSKRPRQEVKWWFDLLLDDDDDVDDDVNGDVDSGFLEQLVDELFMFQVFKSYGWFLPIILLSFILATGPKAFLLGSGILFGLSLVIFAFRRLPEWLEGSSKPQKRRNKRSKNGRKKLVFVQEDDLEEEIQYDTRNKRRDFRSRVNRNNGTFYGKDNSSEIDSNSYGGWDELVGEDETRNFPRETERLERMIEKSMEERDLPLLLKVLVAIFPFLASWTDML